MRYNRGVNQRKEIMKDFKNWQDIKEWATKNNFNNLAKRMQLNNDCWNSSGEFGRSQVEICDALRFAQSEDERIEIAQEFDQAFASNYGLY